MRQIFHRNEHFDLEVFFSNEEKNECCVVFPHCSCSNIIIICMIAFLLMSYILLHEIVNADNMCFETITNYN